MILTVYPWLLWLLLAPLPIELVGEADCPSRDDIVQQLARLAPAPAPAPTSASIDGANLSAEIHREEHGLSIVLRDGDGRVLAERVVARNGSCTELAAAAAVVITAWQGELSRDLGPGLPEIPAVRPPPAAEPATTVSRTGRPADDGGARAMEIGAALLASAAGDDVSPGLEIAAEMGLPRSGLGARLAASFAGPHAIALGPSPGQSRWSRAGLALGLRHRSWYRALAIDGHLEVQGAALFVQGAGFDRDYAHVGFDIALGAGLRLALAPGRVAPFVELAASFWPGRDTAAVTGTPAETALPRFELGAAAGVSFGRFR